jgi:hypothetical protein
MDRFFFDVRKGDRLTYDFRGLLCRGVDHARATAELLGLDLACSGSEEWVGARVEVRNVHGHFLLSATVPEIEQVAA